MFWKRRKNIFKSEKKKPRKKETQGLLSVVRLFKGDVFSRFEWVIRAFELLCCCFPLKDVLQCNEVVLPILVMVSPQVFSIPIKSYTFFLRRGHIEIRPFFFVLYFLLCVCWCVHKHLVVLIKLKVVQFNCLTWTFVSYKWCIMSISAIG